MSVAPYAPPLTCSFQRRARFQPNMFHRESPQDSAKRKKDPSAPVNSEDNPESVEEVRPRLRPKFGLTRWGITVQRHSSEKQRLIPSNPKALGAKSPTPGPSSTVLASSDLLPPVWEVWFAGCHSDVGGGAVGDAVHCSLADISLRWMVKQVVLAQCGIRFDDEALRRADIDISTVVLATPAKPDGELVLEAGPALSTSPGSPGEDGSGENMIQKGKGNGVEGQDWPREGDVLSDIHDQLRIQPLWWLLELMPTKFKWQEPDGTWKSKWGYALTKLHPSFQSILTLVLRINFGRGRQIRDPHPDFHDSVRQRMAVAELGYKPRAKWTPGTEKYVD